MHKLNKRLRLLGLSMMLILSGCCKKPLPPAPPEVVVIKDGDITKNSDGSYTVAKEWMVYRMNIEQKLKEKLLECRNAK